MKYIHRSLLIMTTVLLLGTSLPGPAVHAAAATGTKVLTKTEKTSRTAQKKKQKEQNLKRWMEVCRTMGKNLQKRGFHYSYTASKRTYKAALSSGRQTNCAQFVSWCLQEYGALDKGDTFYVKRGGRIKKNFSKWDSSKVKVIRVYKRCSSTKLQPGDVVCWAGKPHTNIYAGRNKAGKRTWFDAGRSATYGRHNGSRYKTVSASSAVNRDHNKISYIIRIKDL